MEFSSININIYYDLKTQPLWLLLLSSLGFLSLLKSSVSLLKWLYVIFLRPPKNLVKSYGSWALITGSTDGIGKAFAFQLSRKGLNLILVGRNMEKLEHVSSAIQAKYPDTKFKVVVLDFSKDLTVGIHELEKEIVEVDVGVLINNVGVTYPRATYFHEIEEDVWMNLVRVNVEGTSRVTRSVVKGMVERKRGAIVNIGSGAAIIVPSHPLFAVYAATKAYVDQLSRCMFVEYKDWGIDVQCQVLTFCSESMWFSTDFRFSKSGLQLEAKLTELIGGMHTGNLGDLSPNQMMQVDELQNKTVADTFMVELSDIETEASKEDGLQKIVERTDEVRLKTLKGVIDILSPIQAVHFLIAAMELHLRLQEWGMKRDAGHHV